MVAPFVSFLKGVPPPRLVSCKLACLQRYSSFAQAKILNSDGLWVKILISNELWAQKREPRRLPGPLFVLLI
jgi:hypothetical protein